MTLARVIGNVVSTQKNEYLSGHKLLVVHKTGLQGEIINGKDIVAIDLISAGIGDLVLLTQEGDAVQQILGHKNAPVHSIIVAVVDEIAVGDSYEHSGK